MASYFIEQRKRSSGGFSYRCSVRVKKDRKIIHHESKTFRNEKLAVAWGTKRVAYIDEFGLPGESVSRVATIGELIDLYIGEPRIWESTGRTKRYVIQLLRDCDISYVNTDALTTQHLITHCKNRNEAGAQPVTVYHDVSYLRAVMKLGGPVFGIKCNVDVIAEAMPVLVKMKLVGRSQRRTRRPTELELDKLRTGLAKRESHQAAHIPFVDILDFSILTCMRIGEVCALRWEDVDHERRLVLVRNRKDPRKKEGNHMFVPLLGDSMAIIDKQPVKGDLIFPVCPRSVTAGFQRVRNSLGIKDLRYHDLRREGATRLFEMGYHIEEVIQVTGHRNFNMLWNVYQQMNPGSMRDLAKG